MESTGEIVMYQPADGQTSIEVTLENETVWLTQEQIAKLFSRDRTVVTKIAAFLFVWFMQKNQILYRPDGSKRIADNTLVAITLMIAESKPVEKEMMIKVVVSLINGKN